MTDVVVPTVIVKGLDEKLQPFKLVSRKSTMVFIKWLFFFSADSGGAGPQPPQTSENQSGGPNYAENVRGQMFTVGPRYTSLQYIGEGAYGMVV